MKKAFTIILVFVILVTASVAGLAAEFVASIEAKLAPEVVPFNYNGNNYGAVIINSGTGEIEDGVLLYDQSADSTFLELFVISVAEKSHAILSEITGIIDQSEEQIREVSNLAALTAGLDKEIQKAIDAFYGDSEDKPGLSDLIVSDLFDVSLVRERDHLEQVGANQKIRFILKPDFSEGTFFILLHNTEGTTWEVVNDVEWTDDGNLMVTVDKLSVFAFIIEKSVDLPVEPDDPGSPQTNNQDNIKFLYIGLAVLCIGATVFFCTKANKIRKAQ